MNSKNKHSKENNMTLKEVIDKYSSQAEFNNLEPEAVKWLILELSNMTATDFYLNQFSQVDSELIAKIEKATNQYIQDKIPVQHILGFAYFYGNKLKVNADVLIPRRETEELVENVLILYDQYFDDQLVDVIDLGTGSGAIGLTLAYEEPNMKVMVSDISKKALTIAKENAKLLNVNVDFVISNWLANINNKFDIIVANPPYIPNNEEIGITVDKEPSLALYGGSDGLQYYEEILKTCHENLKEKALIAFEHGFQHNDQLDVLIKKYHPNSTIKHLKDLQGKDRFTFIGINIDLNI